MSSCGTLCKSPLLTINVVVMICLKIIKQISIYVTCCYFSVYAYEVILVIFCCGIVVILVEIWQKSVMINIPGDILTCSLNPSYPPCLLLWHEPVTWNNAEKGEQRECVAQIDTTCHQRLFHLITLWQVLSLGKLAARLALSGKQVSWLDNTSVE